MSTPVDSIIKFRAEFGTNDYPIRLIPSPSNVGGSGGSGGGGSTAIETGVVTHLPLQGGGGGGVIEKVMVVLYLYVQIY